MPVGPPPFPAGPPGGRRPRVVIVGGGFAGLYAARALGGEAVSVSVVDHHNHHVFQPLLYQVATAALNPSDIAQPIRRIFRHQPNCTVILGKAVAVDAETRRVILADDAVPYDFLILATGAGHSYFGHDEWAFHAPGLKTVDDALDMRRRILLAFEAAEREPDPGRRRLWLTFVVVGAGPTGVELAGALGEIARHVLTHDFRRIDPRSARVVLVEAGPRILPGFAPRLAAESVRMLERLGVDVLTASRVERIDDEGVVIGGQRHAARTVLWAAGVEASPIARSLNVPLDRAGRVFVNADLTVPGHPEVFVAGDLASFSQEGRPLPGIAPVAIQQGRWAAANIRRAIRGEARLPFVYKDRGTMATIGRAAAIAERGRLTAAGFWAWLIWLFVHILWLIGFRNRFLVIAGWAWTYLRYERGARLITGGACVCGRLGPQQAPAEAPRPGDLPTTDAAGRNGG